MIKIEIIKDIFLISMLISTISCTFIQKTKALLPNNRLLILYSLFINMLFSLITTITITEFNLGVGVLIGILSFVGSDSLYKELSNKLLSYNDLRNKHK